MVKQGYGFDYTRFAFKYMEEFRQYDRAVRGIMVKLSDRAGSDKPGGGNLRICESQHHNRQPGCRSNSVWFISRRIGQI